MIEVHLYGKLRRFSDSAEATSQSIVCVEAQPGDTVSKVVGRLGIPIEQIGSNVFLNGRYATLDSDVKSGDRLGLFPDDMQLLYKWYFAPTNGGSAASSQGSAAEEPGDKPPHQASRNDQGARSES